MKIQKELHLESLFAIPWMIAILIVLVLILLKIK
jgi:hypothetical protein